MLRTHLARITSTGRVIPVVDGLRFVAITSVVLYHLRWFVGGEGAAFTVAPERTLLGKLLGFGDVGVPLFFAISGFILSRPFVEHHLHDARRVALAPYFLRRLVRIEPPYLLSLLLFLGMALAGGVLSPAHALKSAAASALYAHAAVYGEASWLDAAYWSLEVEVQFYVLMPVLAHVFAVRHPVARRLVLAAIGVAPNLLAACIDRAWVVHPVMRLSLLGHVGYFMAGLLLADVHVHRPGQAPHLRGDVLAVLGFGGLLLGRWLIARAGPWPVMAPATMAFLAFAMPGSIFVACLGALSSRHVGRLLSLPWVVTIGGMCYSIYLLHHPLLPVLGRITRRVLPAARFEIHLLAQAVLLLPVLLALAAVYFVCVERPCMARSARRGTRAP